MFIYNIRFDRKTQIFTAEKPPEQVCRLPDQIDWHEFDRLSRSLEKAIFPFARLVGVWATITASVPNKRMRNVKSKIEFIFRKLVFIKLPQSRLIEMSASCL